ncbi:tRNA delta(2)-isopentenylpyrophosphate transferase [Mannheimia haemolytica]|uniref:tRNA delta(2)-isopentenylpyrophosphate transferase n=1 Tax=Mannheimia haemolytica TaxID=75985 RepID=UPI00201BAE2C|nr:tRNA delta(2)-isopentenylpyrophosphate transferase [Mannheimia haemolytica]UQX69371.1 tRNA delta(2)-isopentenylpyrophosphate transferase [Mannheimia haemolytica]
MKRKECSLKSQFKEWLKKEQENDEMIEIATVPQILKRFDKKLAIIQGNRLEKRYLAEWRKNFRINNFI